MNSTDNPPYTRNDFDKFPWPILITDKCAKIIFKNNFSVRSQLFRLKSSTAKLIVESQRDAYLNAIASGGTGIFECVAAYNLSHAVVIPMNSAETAIFFAPGSSLMRAVINNKTEDHHYTTHNSITQLVDVYKKMCLCLRQDADKQAMELLKQSSLRFSRATRHFNYYVLSVTHHLSTELKHEMVDFLELCHEITNYFNPKVAPLGYRMSIKFSNLFPLSIIHKKSFIAVFIELMTVALKVTEDHSLRIDVVEEDLKLIFNYHFKTTNPKAAHFAYMDEMEFVSSICDDNGWGFSWIVPLDDESAVIRLTLPIVLDNNNTLRASGGFTEDVLDDETKCMLEEAFSMLYFKIK